MLLDKHQVFEPPAMIVRALEITSGCAAFVVTAVKAARRAAWGWERLRFAWE